MTRFVNPTPQFCDGNGDPLAFGKVFFYESETNISKSTYADSAESILNTNPVELGADGRMPNCFYTGSARVVVKDVNNVQIWERDPVGGENVFADFGEWQNFIIYDVNDIVELNGKFYKSLSNNNQGNDPGASPGSNANWENINFVGLYNSTISYSVGDVVKTSGGAIWKSVTASNLGNDPVADSGTNWLPAVEGLKIPEVKALEDRTTTSIPQTGGGGLTALRVNELQDASTYTLPLANTVSADQWIDIELPSEFSASQPTVQRSGADTITWQSGTDTEILFDSGSIALRLHSDGVSDWRL